MNIIELAVIEKALEVAKLFGGKLFELEEWSQPPSTKAFLHRITIQVGRKNVFLWFSGKLAKNQVQSRKVATGDARTREYTLTSHDVATQDKAIEDFKRRIGLTT